MGLLILNKFIGKPSDTPDSLLLTILGYMCLNMLTFIHSWRGLYLVYGNHQDNGVIMMTNSTLATNNMEEALRKKLPELYDTSLEHKAAGTDTDTNTSIGTTEKTNYEREMKEFKTLL